MELSASSTSNDFTTDKQKQDDGEKKLFFTTSDLLNKMNSVLGGMNDNDDNTAESSKPRFELQKRLPNGNTVRASPSDMMVADMESKVTQAAKEIESLPSQQKKLEWARIQKQEGNVLYQKQQYQQAMDVYVTCLVVKPKDDGSDNDNTDKTEFTTNIYIPVLANLAQCALQLGHYKKCTVFCTLGLDEISNSNSDLKNKLLFRRGKARRLRGDYQCALDDFMQTTTTKEVEKEIVLVKKGVEEAKRNQQRQQKGMKQLFEQQHDEKNNQNAAVFEQHAATSLYEKESNTINGKPRHRRPYSSLRKQKTGNEETQNEDTTTMYLQYYWLVVASVAKRLLIMLGDEETIQEERAKLEADDNKED